MGKQFTERAWVSLIRPHFDRLCAELSADGMQTCVAVGRKLAYVHQILRYGADEQPTSSASAYETDLLIYDRTADNAWVPRIVIECKRGKVTTHDALTYSSKAATHKHVHPYLRYGILIGAWGNYSLPARLVRHGAHFDFMATWCMDEPSEREWQSMCGVIGDEIRAARYLHRLFADKEFKKRQVFWLLHRPLRIE